MATYQENIARFKASNGSVTLRQLGKHEASRIDEFSTCFSDHPHSRKVWSFFELGILCEDMDIELSLYAKTDPDSHPEACNFRMHYNGKIQDIELALMRQGYNFYDEDIFELHKS